MNTPAANKSTFVTVLAWIFICLSGFATLISILQNIMIQFMFAGADMQAAMDASRQTEDLPFMARFMIENFRWFFLAVFVLSASTLTCSIGLLKRKNWGRIGLITILSLGIAWNILGFAMQVAMLTSPTYMPPDPNNEFQSQFQIMSYIILAFGGAMAVGLSVLHGWIIKRLVSPGIKLEFHADS
ncbi:MAG: hypothetical protein ACREO1_04955 [Arenimonas sp.]